MQFRQFSPVGSNPVGTQDGGEIGQAFFDTVNRFQKDEGVGKLRILAEEGPSPGTFRGEKTEKQKGICGEP